MKSLRSCCSLPVRPPPSQMIIILLQDPEFSQPVTIAVTVEPPTRPFPLYGLNLPLGKQSKENLFKNQANKQAGVVSRTASASVWIQKVPTRWWRRCPT